MCLIYDKQATAGYRKWRECRGMKRVRVWKVLEKAAYWNAVDPENEYGYSLLESQHNAYKWLPGWRKSSRKTRGPGEDEWDKRKIRYCTCAGPYRDVEINRGIHVYLQKPGPFSPFCAERVVPMTAYLKDLVAVNEDKSEAVFMKVFLAKTDYDKAMGMK